VSWWEPAALDRTRWQALVDPILERVARALDSERFPHGLLLAGPPGLGRELAAVEIAVRLVCPGAKGPWSDCVCSGRVRSGRHPDVVAVMPPEGSTQIKIEQVREIVDGAPGRPFEGRHRVWILDGVEAARFHREPANAFLKVLEEPPGHVRFLLLAAKPEAVLPTIRSRCQQLTLPGPAAIAHQLGVSSPIGLAAAALDGLDLAPSAERVRAALRAAFAGEPRELLRLPHLLPEEPAPTEVVAAVALDEAVVSGDEQAAELVRLAAELVAVERQVTALRLSRDRQLVACLLRWWRDLPRELHCPPSGRLVI
jgi:DNA polymerase-3 subunit delta'